MRDVATGRDLPDVLKWGKFSSAAWLKDGSGFFYSRYDAPKEGETFTGVNKFQKVFFHKLGTSQDADTLVYERKDQPDWGLTADVTEDGRFLLIYQSEGTKPENRIFVKDLSKPGATIQPFLDKFDADYNVVGNDAERFYVMTDKDAPRRRLVGHRPGKARPFGVDDGRARGQRTRRAGQRAHGRQPVRHRLDDRRARSRQALRAQRHVRARGGVADNRIHRRLQRQTVALGELLQLLVVRLSRRRLPLRLRHGKKHGVQAADGGLHARRLRDVEVFYPSKDGTKIPLFLTYKKGLKKDGQNPTYLYGYGGFNVPLTPAFSPATIAWMEMGGIFAQASLRGGSEYGKAWHDAGRLAQQAERLRRLHRRRRVPDSREIHVDAEAGDRRRQQRRLAGGRLPHAAARPVWRGLPAVGVLDMLRFHKFTIGWAWKSDYGDPDVAADFETLMKYSPLQNLKPGASYPPTLITTSDHDDRVAPAHSFKFAAAIQAAQAGPAPVLIRIETKAGHGAGKPTSKIIEERADIFAFLVKSLNMDAPKPARSDEHVRQPWITYANHRATENTEAARSVFEI